MKQRRCSMCWVALTEETAAPSIVARGRGRCKNCDADYHAAYYDKKYPDRILKPLRSIQLPNTAHMFPCGCSGILPDEIGKSNKFAVFGNRAWRCRVLVILNMSQAQARKGNHVPVDKDTAHSVVREMMDNPNCVLCNQPLEWKIGNHITPHLHHNHSTGEIYGFTHFRCNTHALEHEVERLKKLLKDHGIL